MKYIRFLPALLLFLYLYVEISLFVTVANYIGVFFALICIIITSVLGASLVKSQGLKNIASIQQRIANQENPKAELIKSISLMLAGFLLLIPGFLTDILGALLLFPPIQHFLVKSILPRINIQSYSYSSNKRQDDDQDIIEGDFKHKSDQ